MSKKRLSLIALLLSLLLAACGGAESASDVYYAEESGAFAPEMEPMEEFAADMDDGIVNTSAGGAAQVQVQERLIIRTGNMNLVVEDTEETLGKIIDLAAERGGWVVTSGQSQRGSYIYANATIRVPAEDFNTTMAALREMATEVRSENTSGQDVTEEFVDLSARLENLEATADRVRSFLEDTENVEEALAVNVELSRLEGDIESLKGRLQFLSQSAAFSTISVDLEPDAAFQPIEVGGWRPEGVAKDAIETLVDALQGLVNITIWLLLFLLPVLLVIAIPLTLVFLGLRRLWRRRRARRAAAAAG
jgi:hypothetical protein